MTWKEDYFEIDLEKISDMGLDPNWNHTKGYSREEMQRWIQRVEEIQKLCRENQYTHADFQKMWQSDNPQERAIGEAYHKFYSHDRSGPFMNHDHVTVEWLGDRFNVVNGRHRVWLAKQYGLRHLPARVLAPDVATLERLRADGERIATGAYPRAIQHPSLVNRPTNPDQQQISPWRHC